MLLEARRIPESARILLEREERNVHSEIRDTRWPHHKFGVHPLLHEGHHVDVLLDFAGSMPSVPVGLSYHEMFAVSLNSPALWRCRACGKQVTNRWHHFHIHTAQRSLCPYCPATYSRIDTLRSHIRTKHREMLFAGKGSL